MKLHLPNGLRKAVMACMAAISTLTTTIGTGIITGGAVTYMLAMPQVKAEWGVKDGILTFYDKDVDYTTTDDGKTLVVPTEGDDGGNYAEPHIAAEASPNSGAAGRTVYSITIAKDTKLVFTDSAWAADNKFFNGYTLQNLIIGNGKNSGALELREGNSTVIVESVSGTLTSVQNTIDEQGAAGKLILGKEGGTINISGTISSEGTTTLLGTINITDISNLSGHTAGYSDGANGFELYDGYAVFSGNVDATAATITLKGESVVLNDNSWLEADIEDGTIYYLNDGLKGSFSKAESGDATGAVIQGTAGGSLEIIGFKDADLADKVVIKASSTLIVGDGSDLSANVVTDNCDILSLTVNKGGKFTIATGGSSTSYNGDITINGGGTLMLTAGDALGWGNDGTGPKSINIGGEDKTANLLLTNRNTVSCPINLKGNVYMGNPEDATLGDHAGLGALQTKLTVTGVNNVIACPIVGEHKGDDVSINVVGEADTLEITGALYRRGGAIDIKKTGAGTLILDNSNNVIDGAFKHEAGVVKFESGASFTGSSSFSDGAILDIDSGVKVYFSGDVTLDGTMVLNGDGYMVISSAIQGNISSNGGKLAVEDLSAFEVEAAGYLTGYGESTTDGFAAGQTYTIANAACTLDKLTLLGEDTATEVDMVEGKITLEDAESTIFFINTEVTRKNITDQRDGMSFNVATAGATFRTHLVEDFSVLSGEELGSATIYLQNEAGTDLLKITNVPDATGLGITIGGENNKEILCSDSTYTGNFTVLSGATLKQGGNDMAGEGVDAAPDRIITIADGGTFDINGSEAYYNIVMEGGAVLTNTGAMLAMSNNAPDGRNIASVTLTGNATVSVPTETLESGGVTVNKQKSFGIVGGNWGATTLNLNNNVLTKTGGSNFYLNNCTISAGTIRVEDGEIELMEYKGTQKTDASAATFELAAATGGLSYVTGSTDIVVGHIIASGGYVRTIGDRSITVNKITGNKELSKTGSGNMSLADGIEITENVNIKVDAGTLTLASVDIAAGKTLNITGTATADVLTQSGAGLFSATELNAGQVNVKDAGSMNITTLTADAVGMASSGSMTVGTMTTKELGLTGTGSMNITTLTAEAVGMAKGLTVGTLAAGATVSYTDVASIGSISTLAGDTLIDLIGVIGSIEDSINLGITYTDDNLGKIQISALDGTVGTDATDTTLDYLLTKDEETGMIVLQATGDDAVITLHTDWDINWGAKVLAGQPDVITAVSINNATADGTGLSETGYLVDGMVAVQLTDNGTPDVGSVDAPMAVVGGAYHAFNTGGGTVDIENGVWINASAGTYGAIVGGNMAGCWGTGKDIPSIINADSHIIIKQGEGETLSLRHVIGGNMGDSANQAAPAQFNGDTYVSVWTDSVQMAVVGGSMAFHGGASILTGDTHVFVYTPLSTVLNRYRNEIEAVVGGMMDADANAPRLTLDGDTHVTIDLSESTATGDFAKYIVGANVARGGYSTLTGDATTVIKGKNKDSVDIKFTKAVVGGTFNHSAGATMTVGNTSLTINGGIYTGGVFGGTYHDLRGSSVTGNTHVQINGGSFSCNVSGGSRLNNSGGEASATTGDVILTITDGVFGTFEKKDDGSQVLTGGIVAAAAYHNSGGTSSVGSVTMSISGGTYNNIVTGGSYMANTGNATTGDIAINITGGQYNNLITGGIYTVTGDSKTVSGNITLNIKGAVIDADVYGAHHVHGTGTAKIELVAEDVTITVDDDASVGNIIGGSYVERGDDSSKQSLRQGNIVINLIDGTVKGDVYAEGATGKPNSGTASAMTTASTTINIGDDVILTTGKTISTGHSGTAGSKWTVTGDRTIMFTGDADQDRTGILFSDFNKIGVETAGKSATIGGADITITDALTVIGNGTIKLAEKTGLVATQGITIEKTATVAVNGNAVTGDVVANGGVNVVGGGSLNGRLTLAAGSTLTLWDGTENGTNGVLDMSVPTVDGASLLAEGNVLTIGGLFGLDVKVNPDGEVELVTGLGGIEGITFDEENKALAGTYLSDINGEDVDGKLYLVYEEGTLKLSAIAGMTDFYWEDTDATGETWTEKLWSVKDNNSDNLVFIKDAATRTDEVNAFFNNGKAENVLVDTTATVDDLTVSGAGSDYTFSQATGTNGTLTIEGKLTVTDSATATFDGALADVGAAEMEVSKGATLFAGAVTITNGVTVDAGTLNVTSLGAASLDASNGASIDADNVEITGKVGVDSAVLDISDSLSAAEITITGDTASVEAGTITVGEGNLSMDGGTLAVDTLTGEGTAEITGGTLTIGSTDLSSVDVSGAEFVGSSTLAGSDAVDVTVGGVSVADGAELNLSDATLTDKMTAGTDATLTIDGAMHLDVTNSDFDLENKSTYAETAATDDLGKEIADGGNGFVSRNEVYTVVTGDLTNVDATGADWTVGADARVGEYDGGKVTISESKDTTAYWVNTGAVEVSKAADNFADDTATIKLNGGILKIDEDTDKAIVTNNENAHKTDSQIALLNGSTLEMEKLTITDGTTVTLSGSADSALDLGDGYKVDSTKLKGLDSTDAWLGTVKTGAINGGLTPVDISGLGNANSSVEADSISGQSMTAGTVGTVDVLGDVSLTNGDSTVNDMTVEGNLSLGATADSSLTAGALTVNGETGVALQNGSTVDADTLTVTNGGIDLSEGSAVTADEALTVGAGITLGKDAQVKAGELKVGSLSLEEGSSVGADTLTVEGSIEYKSLAADAPITVGDMTNDTLDLTVDTELLKDAVDAGQDVTFIHVANGSEAEISLNGGSNVLKNHGEKYSYTVDWDEAGQNVTLDAIANENYMKEKFEGAEPNAIAGATLMDEAFASDGIGAGGDLEKLLASVDNGSMTEEGMAAVAGASTASLGMAFAGDVERQLRAIRNRTTTMGVNQCVVNEGMPYFNAWVNAEGNFGELDQDGLASGYQLDSWGGTVGFDVDVNPNLTLGLAVTAMYGDLTVDGPDMLEGDMDTYYVTAFARYSKRAWTHTFIGTIGMMDGSYERTVNYAGGSYKTEGDTDGMAFGLMYEVGRVYALTEDGDACLQPVFNIAYRHTTVGGYTEDGGDAALDVDDQTLDTITLGAGARFQAVVGENLYNRTSVLELRALAKLDVGDRASEADVAFIGGGSRATVESAELGAFGVELGAGLSIPVGDENDGTIFFDVSAELRSGYSNVNGTVGYRINF